MRVTPGRSRGDLGFQPVKLGVAAADDLEVSPLEVDQAGAERRQLQFGLGKVGLEVFEFFLLPLEFFLFGRAEAGNPDLRPGTRGQCLTGHVAGLSTASRGWERGFRAWIDPTPGSIAVLQYPFNRVRLSKGYPRDDRRR